MDRGKEHCLSDSRFTGAGRLEIGLPINTLRGSASPRCDSKGGEYLYDGGRQLVAHLPKSCGVNSYLPTNYNDPVSSTK